MQKWPVVNEKYIKRSQECTVYVWTGLDDVCAIRTTVGQRFSWYRASRGSLDDSWASYLKTTYCYGIAVRVFDIQVPRESPTYDIRSWVRGTKPTPMLWPHLRATEWRCGCFIKREMGCLWLVTGMFF